MAAISVEMKNKMNYETISKKHNFNPNIIQNFSQKIAQLISGILKMFSPIYDILNTRLRSLMAAISCMIVLYIMVFNIHTKILKKFCFNLNIYSFYICFCSVFFSLFNHNYYLY